ncbi:MAG: FG-GAP-like repeat-containing protein [Planctomycetales bacterium]
MFVLQRRGGDVRPEAPVGSAPAVIDNSQIADAGLALANEFTGDVADPQSLSDLRSAIAERGTNGLTALRKELERLSSISPKSLEVARAHYKIGTLLMYEGEFDEAARAIEQSLKVGEAAGMSAQVKNNLTALLGIAAFRRGEVDNCIHCLGPTSCIFPIAPDAVHTRPAGSRQAIDHFTRYLESAPGDLRIQWMLNLAAMTLGEYPDAVPPQFRMPLDQPEPGAAWKQFQNVAPLVGLTSRGPNQAGGSVFDDLTGDGWPDLFVTSLDVDRGAALFVNRGDGTFEDQSEAAGLNDQVYALNVTRGDFDNDGNLDLLLLRGAWEKPMRMSLLKNLGGGRFEDVTIAGGLGTPIASESASWGDYDNDGRLDIFVCGEFKPPFGGGPATPPDPRNRCRLYHNEGNGRFVEVAQDAGVSLEECSKGSAWGDYDGDGWLDLFVSNMNGPGRLFHNEQNGSFEDVTRTLGVTGPEHGFACWFWDYDNDGRLDLYVNDYTSSLAEFVAVARNQPTKRSSRPRLYRNLGEEGFQDVTEEMGLDLMLMPMGCNFGDLDNDGFLDFYLGTGRMALEVLVPNRLFRNVGGRRFEDVTLSTGTGHLQKGHGVSFADSDGDGDLDLFVEAGGAVPGDRAFNVLFQNPGQGGGWLKVKLVGALSNRSALGARIKATVVHADATRQTIYRTVGNNGSFGGNSLVELIGLGDASQVAELEIDWPTSRTTQSFADLAANQSIVITEGEDAYLPGPTGGPGAAGP